MGGGLIDRRKATGRVLEAFPVSHYLLPSLRAGAAVEDERQPGVEQRLSRAAAQRLSLYLRCLASWPAEGGKVSSGRIAAAVGVSDAQVRRDLAALGHLGQRGIGYDARELARAIRAALGI